MWWGIFLLLCYTALWSSSHAGRPGWRDLLPLSEWVRSSIMLGDQTWFRVSSPCPVRCRCQWSLSTNSKNMCDVLWTTSCWTWKVFSTVLPKSGSWFGVKLTIAHTEVFQIRWQVYTNSPYRSPEWPSGGPHSKHCPPTRQLVPTGPPAHPSETSVFLHWLIHVLVLLSSDSLWCLIPSWLCPPSVRRAARPVMNIQRSAYLTGLSLFSKPLGTIIQPQKNTLNGSSSLSLCFSHFPLLSHSLLSLSPWAFAKHIDPPDRGVHLLLFID